MSSQHANGGIVITAIDLAADSAEGTECPETPEATPLAGLTLAVKDNIDVAGVPTTAGSQLLGREAALRTAPVVAALEAAGARVNAKVNLHEFAYGVSSDNPWHGRTPNPRFPDHVPGGSSGGSAAAIAGGVSDIALGTDTAGSIRIPAACTATVGLRPRNGSLDLTGVFPLCPSFDTVGPMAGTVQLVDAAWQAMRAGRSAGHAAGRGSVRHGAASSGEERALPEKVGFFGDPDPRALELLKDLGVEPVALAFPLEEIEDEFWAPFRAEIARTHAATYPRLAEDYDPNVAAKMANTQGVQAAEYEERMAALGAIRDRVLVECKMKGVTSVVSPVLGLPVPRATDDEVDYRNLLGLYTIPASALNFASLAIGNFLITGLTEDHVLALGRALEEAGLAPVLPALA
ncbi:amidase [Leucobacter sp. cx-328]|uniref:amidase n=1 Tax=unclassified Leucobacter TaxID=2621730 RepID=UPI00165DEEDE|nr:MULTISPECIES: amidase [unclassified Leucobacter]MBC9943624.1 amidase [Leucobacter sp. cx-328]